MITKDDKKNFNFQAEVNQLLQLVTHSLYKNKEIFIRELISNAVDAIDKLRFESITNTNIYDTKNTLRILLEINNELKTITISDNGIGMTEEEVINNLGTIAKSGTKEFLSSINKNENNLNLIGQFGVGFYSSFIVAQKVLVKTKKAGLSNKKAILWISDGSGNFQISDIEKETHGTDVIIYLKQDCFEFLNYSNLKNIITKYSDYIQIPIIIKDCSLKNSKCNEEIINKTIAIWSLPKNEISENDYKEFYKYFSNDIKDPLAWVHHKIEGNLEYTILLYIPEHVLNDLFFHEHKYGLKLYVQKIFVMDKVEQLLPIYLRFVSGIVDAKDLPLNVSREILQENKFIELMRSSITKRILDTLEKIALENKDTYKKFWNAFGNIFKGGIVDDIPNRERLIKLSRFYSTNDMSLQNMCSLDEYISRMKLNQEKIYYVTSEKLQDAKNSPYIEMFCKNEVEVLLLDNHIDEWWISHYVAHKGKKFQYIYKEDIESERILKNIPSNINEIQDSYNLIVTKMEQILGDKISKIRISKHLISSPVCIVTSNNDLNYNMQRILSSLGQNVKKSKPILEINPNHSLIKNLFDITDEQLFSKWVNFLYFQALIIAGEEIENLIDFTSCINDLLSKS